MATVDLADQSGAQLSLNTHFVFAVALSWRSHLPRTRPLLAGSGVGWLASTFRRFFAGRLVVLDLSGVRPGTRGHIFSAARSKPSFSPSTACTRLPMTSKRTFAAGQSKLGPTAIR